MNIVVIADVDMQKEFEHHGIPENITIHFIQSASDDNPVADAYFYLLPEEHLSNDISILEKLNMPVFVNAVCTTLQQLPENFIRINALPGFLQRSIVEVCCNRNREKELNILTTLSWKYQLVPDLPGMISARILAMIINEAYFALVEKVSTKADIDIAMKLGTNYPYGPFEWGEKLGLRNIYKLLDTLSKTDKRYTPAPLLIKEIS